MTAPLPPADDPLAAECLPASQQEIRERWGHPTGACEPFDGLRAELSVPAQLRAVATRHPGLGECQRPWAMTTGARAWYPGPQGMRSHSNTTRWAGESQRAAGGGDGGRRGAPFPPGAGAPPFGRDIVSRCGTLTPNSRMRRRRYVRWSPRARAVRVRLPPSWYRVASMSRRLNSVTAPWKPGMGFGGAGGVTGGAAMARNNRKRHATARAAGITRG